MILLDFMQVAISNIFAGDLEKSDDSLDSLRHMILSSIRAYKMRFGKEYGNIVICCDSSAGYWRRKAFPYYKSNRKSDRNQSGLDWDKIFTNINITKNELIEYFPFKVIEVDGAEADDIIGVLTPLYMGKEPILILSGDKDFKQLHVKPEIASKYNIKVHQYAPIQKEFVTCEDPEAFLIEQIIKGDRGDGIPNILSPQNAIYEGIRQTAITKRFLESFDFETTHETIAKRYVQNESLIDLQKVPTNLAVAIHREYEKPIPEKK